MDAVESKTTSTMSGGSGATPVLVAGSNIWKREASATKIAGKGGEEEAKGERERDFFPFFISLSLSLCKRSHGSLDAGTAALMRFPPLFPQFPSHDVSRVARKHRADECNSLKQALQEYLYFAMRNR